MAFGQVNNMMAGDPWRNEINNIRGCWQKRGADGADLTGEVSKLLASVGDLFNAIGDLAAQLTSQPPQACQPAPVQPPKVENSCHPGGLKSEHGVITTPGGYKIEPAGQFNWNITGPDGHKTEVWGDPHVRLDGKEVFDFKRDTTFVLGDGTRINVSTAPWGNAGATVSKQLEIISGNDRIMVTDIDKGNGKIGDITKDGFASVNNFGNKDVFVMGRNSAQWTFKGKEIIGSNNGGESFKLGQDIAPLVQTTQQFGGGQQWASAVFGALSKMFDSVGDLLEKSKPNPFSQKRSKNDVGQALEAVGELFNALSKVITISNQISLGRMNQNITA